MELKNKQVMYIHYDSERKVQLISNVVYEGFEIFEIELNLIPNFASGKKQYSGYSVDYFFKISEGILSDTDDENEVSNVEKFLFEITTESLIDPEIVLIHNKKDLKWTVRYDGYNSKKLGFISEIPLYICKKNSPNFLYTTYIVDVKGLEKETIELKFQTDFETNIDNISVLTFKKFKSYRIEIINDE